VLSKDELSEIQEEEFSPKEEKLKSKIRRFFSKINAIFKIITAFLAPFFARINAIKAFIGKRPWLVLVILFGILVLFIVLFLFVRIGDEPHELLHRSLTLAAILLVAICVGYSTVVFQTVTGARILTPAVLGFENIYLFLRTFMLFAFAGSIAFLETNEGNFVISFVAMVIFSLLIFLPLLTKGSKGVYILLLVGIILSTLFASLTSFMQWLIDPERFMTIQADMFASFTQPDILLMIISGGIAALGIGFAPSARKLDVISLGRENAISLGVNHKIAGLRILITVAALVAVSTIVVGTVMFLGLIAANLAYQFIKSYKHIYTIPAAILVGAIALVVGQFFMREVFTININIAIIINFFGGIYFIFLLLRSRKKEK